MWDLSPASTQQSPSHFGSSSSSTLKLKRSSWKPKQTMLDPDLPPYPLDEIKLPLRKLIHGQSLLVPPILFSFFPLFPPSAPNSYSVFNLPSTWTSVQFVTREPWTVSFSLCETTPPWPVRSQFRPHSLQEDLFSFTTHRVGLSAFLCVPVVCGPLSVVALAVLWCVMFSLVLPSYLKPS